MKREERGTDQILTRTRPTAAVPTADGPLTAVNARRPSVASVATDSRAQPVRFGVSAGEASTFATW